MLVTILTAAVLAASAAAQQADTTVRVDPRGRLRMEDVHGDVVIHTWDRPELRVHVSDAEGARLRVSAGGPTVSVGLEPTGGFWRGGDRSGDFELTIPATMSIGVSGPSADVRVDGVQGEVNIETAAGDVVLRGGTGIVTIRTVSGDITASQVRARTEVHATSGDVQLTDVSGDVVAESVSGDVTLRRIDAASVEASTVNGDLHYEGTIKDGGHYALKSHNGDVTFAMPPGAGAVIGVNTFSGDFETDIPVQLTEQRQGKRFSFTLGSGGARVELQSFSGDIRLVRQGAAGAARH